MVSPVGGTDEHEDLYRVLAVDRDATSEQIKKAYYRLALQCHPDRACGGTDVAGSARFQLVGRAYEVLSDFKRRKLYDATGVTTPLEDGGDWAGYFRELFHRVTFADLDAFQVEYVGSVEEYEDVLAAYVKNRGDIEKITESVFFGGVESEARYLSLIQRAVSKGIVPRFEALDKIFSDEAAHRAQQRKRMRRAGREAKEAEALAQELGISTKTSPDTGTDASSYSALVATIRGRRQGHFDSLITSLEEKYAAPKKKKSKQTK